jgi:hypothetical protein
MTLEEKYAEMIFDNYGCGTSISNIMYDLGCYKKDFLEITLKENFVSKEDIERGIEKMEWLLSDDTGTSSKAIFRAMVGVPHKDKSTPLDPSDFGRCYRLLKQFPEWESRVKELGDLIDYSPIVNGEQLTNLWKIFADNYEELCLMYEKECVGEHWSAPKMYARMRELFY